MRTAGIAEIRLVAELEIDHLHAGRPRRGQQPLMGPDDRPDARFVDTRAEIEHAAFGGVRVLHVHHDYGSARKIDADGLRARRKRDDVGARGAGMAGCHQLLSG